MHRCKTERSTGLSRGVAWPKPEAPVNHLTTLIVILRMMRKKLLRNLTGKKVLFLSDITKSRQLTESEVVPWSRGHFCANTSFFCSTIYVVSMMWQAQPWMLGNAGEQRCLASWSLQSNGERKAINKRTNREIV